MTVPTGTDVAAWLHEPDTEGHADELLPHAWAIIASYTRGGFDVDDPPDDLAAVAVSFVARLVKNPSSARSLTVNVPQDAEVVRLDAFPGDFSLLERLVLNRYRRRAI